MNPLSALYFHGPAWCCWQGRAPHDICAELTRVDSSHWVGAPDACADLLHRHFHAFQLGVLSAGGALMVWHLASLWWHSRLLRAVAREFGAQHKWQSGALAAAPAIGGGGRRRLTQHGTASGQHDSAPCS